MVMPQVILGADGRTGFAALLLVEESPALTLFNPIRNMKNNVVRLRANLFMRMLTPEIDFSLNLVMAEAESAASYSSYATLAWRVSSGLSWCLISTNFVEKEKVQRFLQRSASGRQQTTATSASKAAITRARKGSGVRRVDLWCRYEE
jgi:hypothetical protein